MSIPVNTAYAQVAVGEQPIQVLALWSVLRII